MKKVIIGVIVALVLLFLALRSEKAQDFFDSLSETHKVDMIQ